MALEAPLPVCLLGTTGVGKSDVAVALARRLGGEVVSCDALAVYRRVPLLTARPDAPSDVPHHLVDFVDPWDSYSASAFARDSDRVVDDIGARGRVAVVVGGTALYYKLWTRGMGPNVGRDAVFRADLEALAAAEGPAALHARLASVDPERAAALHRNDVRRLVRALEIVHATGRKASELRNEWEAPLRRPLVVFGLRRGRDDLDARILARARRMLAQGLVAEVERLDALPTPPSGELAQAIGLADVRAHLRGQIDAATLQERLARATRRFSRRQATFFRQLGEVRWVDLAPDEPPEVTAARLPYP